MKGVTPNMKKSHEYDSPVLSKLVSVVTVLAICVCSICCIVTASKVSTLTAGTIVSGDQQQGVTPNNPSNPTPSNPTPSNPTPDAQDPGASDPGTSDPGTSDPGTSTPGTQDPATPSGPSKEEVLKKYTEVMDQLKNGVAKYEKKEFQALSEDRDLGTIGNAVLGIAEGLMTSEEEAKIQQRDDAAQIPVVKSPKGCILTDVSAIKEAKMTESGGKTTIVIVLNDEKGSLPAPEGATSHNSTVGSMFNPIDQKGIDDIVSKFSGLATINKFELTYKECTATLVFDTATGKVESLEQIMNVFIEVDAKVTILPLQGYATLVNTMRINNVAYK